MWWKKEKQEKIGYNVANGQNPKLYIQRLPEGSFLVV